jgi:hypothetical protein
LIIHLFAGLGEQIRLLMHDNKIAFTDDKFGADKWPEIKATMVCVLK